MTASLPPARTPGDSDWEQLARLLAGELPADQAAAMRATLAGDPALQKVFLALESANLNGAEFASPDVDAALHRVRLRMHASSKRSPLRVWLPLAAAFLLAAGIFWFTQTPSDGGSAVAVAAPQVFRTGIGQRDSIVLSDGSKVVLGPGSELTLEAGFPRSRNVTLKGQARFDVVHDDSRLFTVHTTPGVITDLGTVFTVNDFDGAAIDVSVQSGSVRLSTVGAPDGGVILTAGEAGTINTRGVLTRDARAASDEDLAWMGGRLVFREAQMIKVRAELRRWYGVELVTSDSATAAGRLTASFRDEPLSQVGEIIALALGAKHEIRGDTILLQAAARRSPGR
jgi:transmembrane sensor